MPSRRAQKRADMKSAQKSSRRSDLLSAGDLSRFARGMMKFHVEMSHLYRGHVEQVFRSMGATTHSLARQVEVLTEQNQSLLIDRANTIEVLEELTRRAVADGIDIKVKPYRLTKRRDEKADA